MAAGGNPPTNREARTAISFFRSACDFASLSPFFVPAQSANSSGMAAQRLRKKFSPIACAKDEEKGRKICGLACGIPARNRRISGGKAAEMPSMSCGTKALNSEYLSLSCCYVLTMTSLFFGLPLTDPSTRRSLSCNHNSSARGRENEGCKAVAFGRSFPSTVCIASDSRVSGHCEGEVARTAAQARCAALVSALRTLHCQLKAPPRGAPLFR